MIAGALVTTEAEEIVDAPNEFMRGAVTLQKKPRFTYSSLRRSQGESHQTRRNLHSEFRNNNICLPMIN